LQAEIQLLTAEVQSLEQQLAAAGGGTASWCYTFNNNLSIGMTGAQVNALQTVLQKDGESINVNGTFDDQTAAAVTGFQEKYAASILAPYGLNNGTGYAGKSTRAELNSLFGCGATMPTPTPTSPPLSISSPAPTSNSSSASLVITPVGNIQSSVAAGASKVLIGSYSLTVSRAAGVNLYGLTISVGSPYFQNVQLYINGSPFGAIWNQPSLDNAYSFSTAVPAVIQAGGSATLQIFADVASSASGQITSATAINACLAKDMVENNAISCNEAIGSGLTFSGQSSTNPWIQVQPTTLQFVASPGASNSQAAPKTLTIYTSPSVTGVNVSVTPAQSWLQVSATSAVNNTSIAVTVLPSSLAEGSYTGSIMISSPTNQFSPIRVPVVLTVTSIVSTQPVTILSPTAGAVWTTGTTQNIEWQTASPGQPMSLGISLFQNGNDILSITNSSNVGSYAWTIPGGYTGSNFQIGILGPLGYVYSGRFSITASATSTPTTPSQPPTLTVSPATVQSGYQATFTPTFPQAISYNNFKPYFIINCPTGVTINGDTALCGQKIFPSQQTLEFSASSAGTAPVPVTAQLYYGGAAPVTATLLIIPVPLSDVSLSINGSHGPLTVSPGTPLAIAITASGVSGCAEESASPGANMGWLGVTGWTTTVPTSVAVTAPASQGTYWYSLLCLSLTGLEASDTVTVNVAANVQ
jgi:hypothetical protein